MSDVAGSVIGIILSLIFVYAGVSVNRRFKGFDPVHLIAGLVVFSGMGFTGFVLSAYTLLLDKGAVLDNIYMVLATSGLLTFWLLVEVCFDKRQYDGQFEARVKKLKAFRYGRFAWLANNYVKDGKKGVLLFWYNGAEIFISNRIYRNDGFFVLSSGEPDMKLTQSALLTACDEYPRAR